MARKNWRKVSSYNLEDGIRREAAALLQRWLLKTGLPHLTVTLGVDAYPNQDAFRLEVPIGIEILRDSEFGRGEFELRVTEQVQV